MAVYEALLLNTVVPQIQAAQAGDSYVMVVNATTPALRITQTGTGNAISVEDEANPDATPFVVTASGNLGVGITNPGFRGDFRVGSTGNIANFSDGTQNLTIGTASGSVSYVNGAAGVLGLYTSDTERARITSGGDLLVGTTSYGTGATGFMVNGSSGSSKGACVSVLSPSTDATTTYEAYSTGAGLFRFYVGMGGTVFATNTTISAISDQRFKENIQDLDVGLDKIMALKPRKFDWKEGKGKDIKGDRGWIAQEFEQVFPDMIDEWKDPAPEGEEPYKSVRADLIPVLVKAIQELKAEVDSLKAQLEAK